MKHDPRGFAAAQAYKKDEVSDRIRRFLPMVKRLAWHVHGSGRAGIELEDLIQAGLVALTECSQKHSGPTEDGFAAYAKLRVRGAMVDLVRRSTPLSRSATERRRALREKTAALSTELGHPPSEAELAASMGMTENQLADQRAADEPLRFEHIDDAYSDSNSAFADDRPDSFEMLADQEMRGAVASAIGNLPERLQMIIQLYFVEEMNLDEIGETLGVGAARVCQIKKAALDKMRGMMAD